MPPCISPDYFGRFLDVVLPQVDVLLQAIVLWAVLRIRSTFEGEQRTLSSLVTSVQRSDGSPSPRESRRGVLGRKKS
jgi:hypothetical protein